MITKAKLRRFDTLLTGVIAGLVLPVIAFLIFYYAKIQDVKATLFSSRLVISNIIPVLLSHCILPNIILFFAFNGLDWNKASKGVVIVTIVLTVVLFAFKFIFSMV